MKLQLSKGDLSADSSPLAPWTWLRLPLARARLMASITHLPSSLVIGSSH
jgi:hypothetical protein